MINLKKQKESNLKNNILNGVFIIITIIIIIILWCGVCFIFDNIRNCFNKENNILINHRGIDIFNEEACKKGKVVLTQSSEVYCVLLCTTDQLFTVRLTKKNNIYIPSHTYQVFTVNEAKKNKNNEYDEYIQFIDIEYDLNELNKIDMSSLKDVIWDELTWDAYYNLEEENYKLEAEIQKLETEMNSLKER